MESGGTYWHAAYFFDLIYKGHLSSSVPVIFFKKLPIILLEGCTVSYAMVRYLFPVVYCCKNNAAVTVLVHKSLGTHALISEGGSPQVGLLV